MFFTHPIVTKNLMIQLLGQHISLVATAVLLATCIALLVGIWATRPRRKDGIAAAAIVRLLSLGQSIPSLAVLGLIMAFLGIGRRTAAVALTVYAIVPMLSNVMAGLESVDEWVLDSARGMGMPPLTILRRIELPLALPTIMAGIRTSTVVTISTAALSSQIGGGGMGRLIFMGIALMDPVLMLMGGVPTAIMAIGADFLLGLAEKRLTRWRKIHAAK